ncbi:hypothetical protein ScPMuIL_009713 [Solemya velum]
MSGDSPSKVGYICRIQPSNKPLMEKRRRARINDCLSQLKTLVLQAMKKDTNQYSKLEKADILEMTVKHLKTVQRHHGSASASSDPLVMSNYRAGFNECLNEVSRFLRSGEHVNSGVKEQMMTHLANCVNRVPSVPQADVDRTRSHERHAIEQRTLLRGYVYSPDAVQMCGIPPNCNTQLASLPGYSGYPYGQEQYLHSDGEESRQSFYGDYSKDMSDDQSSQHLTSPRCYSLERTSPSSASEDVKPNMRSVDFIHRPSLSPSRPESAGGLSDSMWRPW